MVENPSPPLKIFSRNYKILVIEDTPIMRDLLQVMLGKECMLWLAVRGKEGVEKARRYTPDLVLLDWALPDMDGSEVLTALRNDRLTYHIPVVVLTAYSSDENQLSALQAGADDFLTKPINRELLQVRLAMVLRRLAVARNCNPLTGLPGNLVIEEEIQKRLTRAAPLSVGHVDLNHFKVFNDYYGYKRGDQVIVLTGQILLDTLKSLGNEKDFLGHIGGDDFLIVTEPARHDRLCQAVLENFDALIPFQYDEADRERKGIEAKDRQGNLRWFPIMSLAIGVATNRHRVLTTTTQVSDLAAEVKKFAKTKGISFYFVDRRTS